MRCKYKPIINMMLDLREHLRYNGSMEVKRMMYARTTGYIFGYISAWNYSNNDKITINQIDLIYKYVDTLHDKYIMNKQASWCNSVGSIPALATHHKGDKP